MYDYIIVGSGLYGAIFAHEAMKAGKSCLVVERRSHIGGNIYTKDGKTLVRVATLKKNVKIVDGCENICTSAFLYTPLGLNWEAKLRKHIDNLFIPKTVKNIDEKSYITYESEPEKITSEERAKVQKGAVTINNIQIENKNFDVNILSKLLDKVTCNKDEVLKQLTAK